MKRIQSVAIAIVLLAFILTVAPPVNAAEPTEQLKGTINSILTILQDVNFKGPKNKVARRAALSKAVSTRFSFKEMSKRSLGKNWRERTSAEKKEFTSVFRKLIQNSYFTKMETYTDEKILYDKERTKGRSSVIKTFVITKTATEIPIDYRMKLNKSGEWMVYDIVVEGISLIRNYRSSFSSELRKGSFGELVAKLKKKTAEKN